MTTYVSLRMGEKALPTTPVVATDRVAEGPLIEVNADAVAARDKTASDSFILIVWGWRIIIMRCGAQHSNDGGSCESHTNS